MEEKDSAASQAPFTLVVTDVGPSPVVRLPHCTKACPRGGGGAAEAACPGLCPPLSPGLGHQEDRGPFVFTQRCSKHGWQPWASHQKDTRDTSQE